ncbi:MAG: TetR/AcrR family transcriptional regulator [Mycobacteriales bacterium]|nr:TetR/AcrR family transcriptional regulator [Mycobacteriales bacterium]
MTPTPAERDVPRGTRLPRQARRKQLLGAAQEIFVAQGYHAAAMDDIAERAGVSKPVLYQHFPGKLELYLALLDEHAADLTRKVVAALQSTTDNRLRVAACVAAYFDFVDGDGEAFRLVFESDLRNDPAVRARVEKMTAECVEAISETIAHDTGFGHEDSKLLAVGLTGMAEVGARWWLAAQVDGPGSVPKERAVELLVGLSWRGISGAPLHG